MAEPHSLVMAIRRMLELPILARRATLLQDRQDRLVSLVSLVRMGRRLLCSTIRANTITHGHKVCWVAVTGNGY